jgi:DNA replication and repair protein RecF
VLGLLRTVVFAPEDVALVKGAPGERRRFLDDLLVVRRPRYAGVRANWERALKQRNALLRSAAGQRRVDEALLDVFDGHVARTGAALLAGRLALIAALRGPVARAYAEVSGSAEPADLRYQGTVDVPGGVLDIPSEVAAERLGGDLSGLAARMEELLLDRLAARRRDELDRGITLVGPHRDELELRLGVRPVRGYASHGESWSFALALRLASFDLLRHDPTAPGDPVLILDDVFAELDVGRRSRLAALVADAEQVLVTAAVADDVPSALRGARFQVTLGQVEPMAPDGPVDAADVDDGPTPLDGPGVDATPEVSGVG